MTAIQAVQSPSFRSESGLGIDPGFFYREAMIGFLRFLGILTAAVWLGGAIFFTFAAGTAAFSGDMKSLLGNNYPYYSGAIAQIFIARYFRFHLICGSIAIVHVLAEWLYLGKTPHQMWLSLLIALLCLGVFGQFVVQPKMKALHTIKYANNTSLDAKRAAEQSFRSWHAGTQVANLLMICGLLAYLWRVANPPDPTRFVSATKFTS